MGRHVGAAAAVPLGIDIGAGEPLVLSVLRREIQRKAQPRGGALQGLRQVQVVLVLGGLGGVVLIVVIHHPVQVEALRPGHDGLEAVDDEAVVAVGLVALLAAGILAGRHRHGGARVLRVVGRALAGLQAVPQAQPDRHRRIAAIAPRRRAGKTLARVRGASELVEDQAFEPRLAAWQAAAPARLHDVAAEAVMNLTQPGAGGIGAVRGGGERRDLGPVGGQRIGLARRDLDAGGERGQPEIAGAVQLARGKAVDHRRQAQAVAVEIGHMRLLARGADPADKVRAVIRRDEGRGGDLHPRAAAKRPEERGGGAVHLREGHGAGGIAPRRAPPRGHVVPEISDGFLRFHEIENVQHRRHP